MQHELITKEHRTLLQNDFSTTFEDAESMTDEQFGELVDRLAMAECDEDDKASGDEYTKRGQLVSEIIDILCGPYDEEEDDFADG